MTTSTSVLPSEIPPIISDDKLLDINTATEDQLAALPGMDSYRARLIVLHRQAVLGFNRVDQLQNVFGISEEIYQGIAPLLKIGPRLGYQKGTLGTEIPQIQPVQRPTRPVVRFNSANPTSATATPSDSMLPSIAP